MKVTSGRLWREKVAGGVVLRLPSGMVARIRSVQPDAVLKLGRIPDSLTPLIAHLMEGKEEAVAAETLEQLRDQTEFFNSICEFALIEPRIVANPQADDEIGINHLEWPDKVFLLGTIGATTTQLESFRDEQESNVGGVGTSEGNVPPSE